MKKTIFSLAALLAAGTYTATAENVLPEQTDSTTIETAQRPHKEHRPDGPRVKYAPIDLDTDNGVVSLAGSKGFTIQTKKGDFIFKPYMLVQTSGNFNWYDDEGLDKAYNQDNVANGISLHVGTDVLL